MNGNFGKIVKKARIDAGVTLSEMAKDLGVSPSFLSSMENAKKKISSLWVKNIKDYFGEKGVEVKDLDVYASVANDNIDMSELSLDHKMLVSQFANSELSAEELKIISKFFENFNKK
ncbi:hypothetical protein B9T11_05115 [Wohlfahrtiimonas chitiniclastica]|uniref:helix-turn-helix domain-containing protein n=1 Tax=Wohlfahrtiimonas chitiniclastica TaxID=400946 RepID=UPI000B97FB8E|nr:helix-turn-helix domain-containing protein [Wohlfahrtiimonas chitiniclastica]OYQ80864.1 hypothetical protein B9T11_05115 [Wohlfahrtiimonas chitiniclastica]